MSAEELRKIAALLRADAAKVAAERDEKLAHVVRASAGLALLKRKLEVR